MEIYSEISNLLAKQGIIINLSTERFIGKVSNIYHKYESSFYDKHQQSLLDSIPYWAKAFSLINKNFFGKESIKVLDFGCGTGFATLQLINSELIDKVSEITCYDLSDEMLGQCKNKIDKTPLTSSMMYISKPDEILTKLKANKYDLVMTNSLLHHIPNPKNLVKLLMNSLNAKGYYICGHEPNKSFYFNEKLVLQTKQFRFYKRIYKRLNFQYIFQKVGLKRSVDIIEATNTDLINEGIINKPIPAEYLIKLIDIHVPIGFSKNQCWGELGFSHELFKDDSTDKQISIPCYFTYSHIKDPLTNEFKYWKDKKLKLSSKYPDDGADFLAVVSVE